MSQDPDRYQASPTIAFIRESNKMRIPPAPHGLIKRRGRKDEVNVKHYNLGNNHLKALASSMKHLKPKAINLGSNKNNYGIASIVKSLDDNLERLDLSQNLLSLKSVMDLSSWMVSKAGTDKLKLKILNLSNNKLSDDCLVILSKGLRTARPDLKELDLSKNLMSDVSCFELSEFIESAQSLEILNLSWNRITSFGGTRIFEGIREGRSCRNINMAYNSLGKQDSFTFVEAVQSAINEETLKHLDLSYNRMKKCVCERFAMLIMDNHTLYGLHMEGNECYVDKFGFLLVDNNINSVDHEKHSIIYPRSLNGFSTTMKFSKKNKSLYRPVSNCWVCEGWSEQTFEFKLGKSYPDIVDPVHIHFEYNFYKPELMRSRRGEVYTYTTMCPPGKIKYFFTIDKNAVVARDHLHTGKKMAKLIENIDMYDEIKSYSLPVFNYRIIEQKNVLNDCYMAIPKECFPRCRQLRYRKQVQYRIKDIWDKKLSVFAEYQPDTQELMNKLFETDWSMIIKPKFNNQTDLDNVKAELKKHYWTIRDSFKYYASISSSTGSVTFALTLNSYTDYLKQAGVYKQKTVGFTDTDTMFFTINKREKPSNLNPGNAIIRYQFLEIMLRIGLKYSKLKDPGEAITDYCTNVVAKSLK